MKVSELEGIRYIQEIECSCGAKWVRTGDKPKDKRERQRFIAKHADHDITIARSHAGTTTLTKR